MAARKPAKKAAGTRPASAGKKSSPDASAEKELNLPPIEVDFSGLNIYQKIIWVRQNLPAEIKKETDVGFGNSKYKTLSHEQVNEFLRPLMNKAGLVDTISQMGMDVVDSQKRQGTKNNIVLYCQGLFNYKVINAEKPEEYIATTVSGWGEDAGDKGPGKAQTYAFKAGRTKTFSIAAGENEEARIPDEQLADPKAAETVSPEQISHIMEKADELFGDDSEAVLKRLCSHIFGIDALAKIPADQCQAAITALEGKAKRDSKEGDSRRSHFCDSR